MNYNNASLRHARVGEKLGIYIVSILFPLGFSDKMAAELPDEVHLNLGYLTTLKKALESVAEKWYSFGEVLKVGKATLDELESNNMDSSTLLLLVLNHYLSGVPNPTKTGMVAALRAANFIEEANAVEKCLCTTTSGGKTVYIYTYQKVKFVNAIISTAHASDSTLPEDEQTHTNPEEKKPKVQNVH